MKQRGLRKLALLMGLISAVALTGCGKEDGSGKANDNPDIVIGTADGSLCLAPLHIAIENGYFEEEFKKDNITWKLEEIDLGNIADLVASDQIDASLALAGAMIPQIDNGLEITFTAGVHTGCTKVYSGNKDVHSIKDLKGKKIGVPSLGDSSVVALKRALYDAGIGVSTENLEVEWVTYALTDLPLALSNGAIDAAALHDPVAYSAEQEYQFEKILDLSTDDKFKDEYCCMSFVTSKLAKENPKAAAAYTRAILRASAFVQADTKVAAKIQSEANHCSGDIDTNASLLATYNYRPSVANASKTILDAADELIRIGELKSDDPESFVKRAFTTFDGVPESYVYENGEFKEVN